MSNYTSLKEQALGAVAIKPSGVVYSELKVDDMVVLDLDGTTQEGTLRPSSDTPTHLALYGQFPDLGGIVHTHSTYPTSWTQACRSIPLYGTTHADFSPHSNPQPLPDHYTNKHFSRKHGPNAYYGQG